MCGGFFKPKVQAAPPAPVVPPPDIKKDPEEFATRRKKGFRSLININPDEDVKVEVPARSFLGGAKSSYITNLVTNPETPGPIRKKFLG